MSNWAGVTRVVTFLKPPGDNDFSEAAKLVPNPLGFFVWHVRVAEQFLDALDAQHGRGRFDWIDLA